MTEVLIFKTTSHDSGGFNSKKYRGVTEIWAKLSVSYCKYNGGNLKHWHNHILLIIEVFFEDSSVRAIRPCVVSVGFSTSSQRDFRENPIALVYVGVTI